MINKLTPTLPRFVSEKLPSETAEYVTAKNLFHAGHHPILPDLRKEGIIEYERGAAAVGITPHGEMILISTTDIDNLNLKHRFRSEEGKEFYLSSTEVKRDLHDIKPGEDVLGDGSLYLGQFIERREYQGGDVNYDHILGVAAWKPTPQQLVHDILHRFSNFHRRDLLESGTLIRTAPHTWTSKEIVYQASPLTMKNWDGRVIPKRNNYGEPLFDLMEIKAPRKGWDASKLYQTTFLDEQGSVFANAKQYLLRALIPLVADHQRGLSLREIKGHLRESFSPTVKFLRKGESPFKNGEDENPSFGKKVKGWLRHTFTAAVFGIHEISQKELALTVAAPACISIGANAMEAPGGITSLAGITSAGAILAAHFGKLLYTRARPMFTKDDFTNLIRHFWPENTPIKKIPYQFEMVRPDVLKDLRILTKQELDRFSRIPSNKPEKAPSWDMLYLLGMQNGPYGSQSSVHKVGDHWVVLSEEDPKKSGLQIEYWPLLNVAFAKNPACYHLPQTLLDSFAKAQKPVRMVKALCNAHGETTGYESRFLTESEYLQEVEKLKSHSAPYLYRRPEPVGCLPDYPLDPVNGHLPDHEDGPDEPTTGAITDFITEVLQKAAPHR